MKVGDRVKFLRTQMFWFQDIVEAANKLDKEKVYTVSWLYEHSSWTAITLVETGPQIYNHAWFEVV